MTGLPYTVHDINMGQEDIRYIDCLDQRLNAKPSECDNNVNLKG